MFTIKNDIGDLKVKDRSIYKILYSMNSHPVATPEMSVEEARCYILFFSEGPNLSAFIGLYLPRTDRKFFYTYSNNPFPMEGQGDVEDEARNFAEDMGFLLDEINVAGMAAEDRNHWIEEQYIFGYKKPDVAEEASGPADQSAAGLSENEPAVKAEPIPAGSIAPIEIPIPEVAAQPVPPAPPAPVAAPAPLSPVSTAPVLQPEPVPQPYQPQQYQQQPAQPPAQPYGQPPAAPQYQQPAQPAYPQQPVQPAYSQQLFPQQSPQPQPQQPPYPPQPYQQQPAPQPAQPYGQPQPPQYQQPIQTQYQPAPPPLPQPPYQPPYQQPGQPYQPPAAPLFQQAPVPELGEPILPPSPVQQPRGAQRPAQQREQPAAQPRPVAKKKAAVQKPAKPAPAQEKGFEEQYSAETEADEAVVTGQNAFEAAYREQAMKRSKPKVTKPAVSATGSVSRDKEALARLLASF